MVKKIEVETDKYYVQCKGCSAVFEYETKDLQDYSGCNSTATHLGVPCPVCHLISYHEDAMSKDANIPKKDVYYIDF